MFLHHLLQICYNHCIHDDVVDFQSPNSFWELSAMVYSEFCMGYVKTDWQMLGNLKFIFF